MEFSKEQMDKWEDRSTKKTMEYHNALLELLQKKLDKNNNELDKKEFRLGCVFHLDFWYHNRGCSEIFF